MATLQTFRDVVSSDANYYLFDADPSVTSIGFDADVGALLVRTDVPSLYFKASAGALAWILAGVGTAVAPVVGKMIKGGGAQIIPDLGSNVLVTFIATDYSVPAGLTDLPGNRFVIPVAGVYLITGIITWGPAVIAAGDFILSAFVGGVKIGNASQEVSTVGSIIGRSNIVVTSGSFAAGDAITLRVTQASGAAQPIVNGEMSIQRVG